MLAIRDITPSVFHTHFPKLLAIRNRHSTALYSAIEIEQRSYTPLFFFWLAKKSYEN